jgi:hypothetical protein
MTMPREAGSEKKPLPVFLPWWIAAGALVAYLITCNHGVAFGNLPAVGRLSGNTWRVDLSEPLTWLVTYPLHWLPTTVIPLALNVLAAVCASLTLALLARSVALLPRDRTEDQREREHGAFSLLSTRTAWLPPVFAVLVCGLQLTFWEQATVFSGEMLNLLLFAYVIRCLLEFRLENQDSWLFRAALVYGVGMANNWAMAGFLPLFFVALIWIKGLHFFNAAFLSRMFLLSLLGLSLYLLLPLGNALFNPIHVGFWLALRRILSDQKNILLALPFNKDVILHSDPPLWVLALPAFLPVLVMGIRWPSSFGDPSNLGKALTNFIFHVAHIALLFICLWVALGPEKFCPRYVLPGLPLLPFYYLGALSVGYYSGYFLLFGVKPRSNRPRPEPALLNLLRRGVVSAVWLLAVLTPLWLLLRDLPQLLTTNGNLLQQYVQSMTAAWPPKGSVLLSDGDIRLHLVQSALAQAGKANDYLLLDTASLEYPDYYKYLKRKYPRVWTRVPPKEVRRVSDLDLINLVVEMARTNAVYYLHPSFGYYFELLYPEPHGLVCKLNPRPTDTVATPVPSPQLIAENQQFWKTNPPAPLKEALQISARNRTPGPMEPGAEWLARKLHLVEETNGLAIILGACYSLPLNAWGVELQRAGYRGQPLTPELKSQWLEPAADHFRLARQLNPNNVVAQYNLDFNQKLQTTNKISLQIPKALQDQFGIYRDWQPLLQANGPFDEPGFCFAQGVVFAQGRNYHQAAAEFARATTLAPDDLPSRMWLASLDTRLELPDEALKVIADIHTRAEALGFTRANQADLLPIETAAHLTKGDLPGATNVVHTALAKYPDDRLALLDKVVPLFWRLKYFSNTLAFTQQQLQINPTNVIALDRKSVV